MQRINRQFYRFSSASIEPKVQVRKARVVAAKFNVRGERVCLLLVALNLGLVVRWHRKFENGAARLMRINPQSSSVRFNDGPAY